MPATTAASPEPLVGRAGARPEAPPEVWFDRSSIAAPVMVTVPGVSEDDWWAHAPETQICEFLDGVVYMPPPASDEHQDEVSFLAFLLQGFASERQLGRARCGPAVLTVAPGKNFEPDVFVTPPGVGPHAPPALIVVEVLSPGTRAYDLGQKLDRYRDALIPEVLHIDGARHRLIVHTRADDLYLTTILTEGAWQSAALPGFWIDVGWLFGEDLQRPLACLNRILAGPPA